MMRRITLTSMILKFTARTWLRALCLASMLVMGPAFAADTQE